MPPATKFAQDGVAAPTAESSEAEEVALSNLVERAARCGAVSPRRRMRAPSEPSEVSA